MPEIDLSIGNPNIKKVGDIPNEPPPMQVAPDAVDDRLPCSNCGNKYDEFTVPNEVWNVIVRGATDGRETDNEYLCLTCYNEKVADYILKHEGRYDSAAETYHHIQLVQHHGGDFIHKLTKRFRDHDNSKLHDPEKKYFDQHTPRLRSLTYGSPEYKECLQVMAPALAHHYALNSHHPEHYEDGFKGMNLLDIVEMLCDWKAATSRMDNGNILASIEINQERFGYDDVFKGFLINTCQAMGWIPSKELKKLYGGG